MVWGCITHRGRGPLVFIEEGIKINQSNYVEMLQEHLIPWAKKVFGWDDGTEEYEVEWVYQQDSAPSHKAKETQRWLRENVPDFITVLDWPPYSPDLNPLDYSILGYIKSIACTKPHESVKSLKKAIRKAWDEMPDEIVKRVMDSWLAASKRVSMQKEDILNKFLLLSCFY
uniref:Tc1-like transposase DDE domain-containing protein n=1 Tax=Acrobeloides nanus TaxID=290746 RepID=A0A914CVH4_9BILA